MVAENVSQQPSFLVVSVLALLLITIIGSVLTKSVAPLRRFFDTTVVIASFLSILWLLLSFWLSFSVNDSAGVKANWVIYLYNASGLVGFIVLAFVVYFLNFVLTGSQYLSERLYGLQKFVPLVFALVNFSCFFVLASGN